MERKKAQFLEVYAKTRNKSKSASSIDVTTTNVDRWRKTDSAFEEQFLAIRDAIDDAVEDALLEGCLEGNPTLLIFYAKTKLRERGYVEKQEVDINAKNMDIKVKFDE